MILLLAEILAFAIGLLFLYIAFFLYEGEEKKIQSRIEDQWMKFYETSSSQIEAVSSAIGSLAKLLDDQVNKALGKRSFSIVLVKISFALSIETMLIFSAFYKEATQFVDWASSTLNIHWNNFVFIYTGWAALLLMITINSIATNSSEKTRKFFKILSDILFWPFFGSIVFGLMLPLFIHNPILITSFIPSSLPFLIFLLAIFFVIIAISFIRLFVKKMSHKQNTFSLFLLTAIGLIIYLISISPLIISEKLEHSGMNPELVPFWKGVLQYVYLSNIPAKWVSFILVSIILSSIGHKIFWAIVTRSTYAIQRYDVIKNKKILGVIGLLLIAFAIGSLPQLLGKIEIGF